MEKVSKKSTLVYGEILGVVVLIVLIVGAALYFAS